jgi:hypothetical protein
MTSVSRPVSQPERSEGVLAEIVEEVTNRFHAGEAADIERYVAEPAPSRRSSRNSPS